MKRWLIETIKEIVFVLIVNNKVKLNNEINK